MTLSDRKISLMLEYSTHFLSNMKHNNYAMYRYITIIGKGDRLLGYRKYIEYQEQLKLLIEEKFFDLNDRRKFSEFAKYLVKAGLFNTTKNAYRAINKALFNGRNDYGTHDTFLQHRKIMKIYLDNQI